MRSNSLWAEACREIEAKGKGKLRTALVPKALDVRLLDSIYDHDDEPPAETGATQ
jgi:hypothetical protein